jgi:hypothetical protein
VALLSTCKQIALEGAKILYGENTFVFDTSGKPPFTHLRGDDAHDAFDTLRHHILGLPILGDHPRPQGKPASQRQIWSAIDRMFDNDGHHPLFIYQDPWMKFFIEIGRTNAQLLTKIKIEGIFMTAKNN